MPITSGIIEYERRLNLGEYSHKHVVAKVQWVVEPGEDDDVLAAFAIDKAVMRVRDILNWKPAVPAEVVLPGVPDLEPDIEAPDLVTAVAEITAGIPPTLKRHRRTKAEMEAARAAAADNAGTNRYGEPIADPPLLTPELNYTPGTTVEPGMPSFDPEPTPPAEVTDLDLQNACQARVSTGLPHATIKELVAKFSPGALAHTPQDARHRFLEELAKL